MGQVLHGGATTIEAVRRAIQARQEGVKAAANACLRMIGWLARPGPGKSGLIRQLAASPFIVRVVPPLFLFVLAISLCAHSAVRAAI